MPPKFQATSTLFNTSSIPFNLNPTVVVFNGSSVTCAHSNILARFSLEVGFRVHKFLRRLQGECSQMQHF